MRKPNRFISIQYLILLLIIIVGFWLRLQGIVHGTFAFTYDVGRDLLAVHSMIYTHKFPLIGFTTGLQGIFYGPWWYYLLLPPFILFGGNPTGMVFYIVLSGVLSIFIGYNIGKKIDGTLFGTIIAAAISFSGTMVGISSQLWNPNVAPLFVLLLILCILWIPKSKKYHYHLFLGVGLLLGLIQEMEFVFGSLFLFGTFIFLFLCYRKWVDIKRLSFSILGFLIILSPRILFEFRHNFLMTHTFFSSLFGSSNQDHILTFSPRFSEILKILFTQWNETLANENPIIGLLMLIVSCIIIFLNFKIMRDTKKTLFNFIAVLLLTFFLGLSFFNHDIFSHYIVGLPVLYLLFFSLAILIAENVIQNKKIYYLCLGLIFIFLVNPINFLKTFQPDTWEGDPSVYRNQIAVVDSIYHDAHGKPFNSITYTPPIFDYTYQYLYLWYGKNRYGYIPDMKKEKLYYFILEPDSQFPIRLENWLAIRKNDGKIVDQWKIKGGITVQKRIHS